MKIHYLSGSELPSPRANSVHVMKMCSAFAGNGHSVTLFAYRPKGEPAYDGDRDRDVYAYYEVEPRFSIEPIPHVGLPGAKRLFRTVHALAHSRRTPQPDLFYGRDLYSLLAVRGADVPLVFEAHTPPMNRSQLFLIERLLRTESLARVVVISQALADRYREIFPWLGDRLCVAHDAADLPQCPEADCKAPGWAGRDGALQVGYVGSLYQGKGADIAAALASRLPAIDFHVLGGTSADVERIRQRYPAPNLFLYGHIDHGKVARYLRAIDVALLPAQRRVVVASGADIGEWMSPLKLFEYMAAKLCIVASDLPVIGEVLEDGRNALLVPPTDLDAWANALERLARDPQLRLRLAEGAHRDFTGSYTWNERSRQVLAGLPGLAADVH